MKKLFENWRVFEKNNINELEYDLGTMVKAQGPAPDTKLYSKLSGDEKELSRQLFSILDPTGVLSWKDVGVEYEKYQTKPSKAGFGWLMLAILSAMPLYLGTAPKAAFKFVKFLDKLKDAEKMFRKVGGGEKIADNIAKGIKRVEGIIAAQKSGDAAADAAQVAGRTVKAVHKLNKVEAMQTSGGQLYVIVKTSEGNIPFYLSRGTSELSDKVWLPFFGITGVVRKIPDPSGLNPRGLIDLGSGGSTLRKLRGDHAQALKNWKSPRTGKVVSGKYVESSSEFGKISKAIPEEGWATNVNKWANEADFLSNNLKSLQPGMSMSEIAEQANRGFVRMDMSGITANHLEDIVINLHLSVNKVNFNYSKMGNTPGTGVMPGINSEITLETLRQALNLGAEAMGRGKAGYLHENTQEHKVIFENWRNFNLKNKK